MVNLIKNLSTKIKNFQYDKDFTHKMIELLDILIDTNDIYKNTTWHPLSFIILKLGDNIKLHIWPDTKRALSPEVSIHSHQHDLISFILTGEITNLTYKVKGNENGNFAIYNGSYEDNYETRILTKTQNRVECELINKVTYKTGDSYQVNHYDYHTSFVPTNKFTSTLVVTLGRKNPIIIGDKNDKDKFIYKKMECNDDLLKLCLINLKKNILNNFL